MSCLATRPVLNLEGPLVGGAEGPKQSNCSMLDEYAEEENVAGTRPLPFFLDQPKIGSQHTAEWAEPGHHQQHPDVDR